MERREEEGEKDGEKRGGRMKRREWEKWREERGRMERREWEGCREEGGGEDEEKIEGEGRTERREMERVGALATQGLLSPVCYLNDVSIA